MRINQLGRRLIIEREKKRSEEARIYVVTSLNEAVNISSVSPPVRVASAENLPAPAAVLGFPTLAAPVAASRLVLFEASVVLLLRLIW